MAPRAAALATFPDDDDLLSEFLLRLPPKPSSLPRASLVCKRWHRVVTDHGFRRRFRERHRNPPLIGVFEDRSGYPFFRSVMDPPDLIPPERFRPQLGGEVTYDRDADDWSIFGCRHDRVLLFNRARHQIALWDPLNGDHRTVAVPLLVGDNQEKLIWNGAVLCADAGKHGHVHGGFSSCPFKVFLVGVASNNTRMFAHCYSSESGQWNTVVSTAFPFRVYFVRHPGVLVGNALYWMALGEGCAILEFDLSRHSLDVLEYPTGADSPNSYSHITRTEDGGLGWTVLSSQSLQMWERKVCSQGVARWVLQKTEKMFKILGMPSQNHVGQPLILGYAEDVNVIMLWMNHRVYMLDLATLQSTKLWETHIVYPHCPYTSSYASGP